MTTLIAPLSRELIPSAQRLVNSVFPRQCLSERISFWTYPRRNSRLVRLVFRALGVHELHGYWVATDERQVNVVGIAGLYSYNKDTEDAVWLGWYCVAPQARGTGVGGKVLDFAIDRARETGKRSLRLYTSTDPNEATAQHVYEKKGFRVVDMKPGRNTTLIFREKSLR
jgi:GNAT superfamily N-acetyltransferase